jgi:hypothetical protein
MVSFRAREHLQSLLPYYHQDDLPTNIKKDRSEGRMASLEQLKAAESVGYLDETRLKRELKARLADLKGLLSRHLSGARQLLKILLERPLHFETATRL